MEYRQRAAGLDGLRGMAAVMVVVYQAINLCDLTVPTRVIVPKLADVPLADWPGRFALGVFNADAAINIFFILSGLVLSVSLQREREFDAGTAVRFVFRRILRIYPALIVTVLVFGAASYVSLPALFSIPFAPRQMLLNGLLLETGVNGETWTLQAAMLMVPVTLFVAWLQRVFGAVVPLAFVLFALFCLFNGPLFGMLILRASLLAFALGMLIATNAVRQLAMKLPAWLWGLCLVSRHAGTILRLQQRNAGAVWFADAVGHGGRLALLQGAGGGRAVSWATAIFRPHFLQPVSLARRGGV